MVEHTLHVPFSPHVWSRSCSNVARARGGGAAEYPYTKRKSGSGSAGYWYRPNPDASGIFRPDCTAVVVCMLYVVCPPRGAQTTPAGLGGPSLKPPPRPKKPEQAISFWFTCQLPLPSARLLSSPASPSIPLDRTVPVCRAASAALPRPLSRGAPSSSPSAGISPTELMKLAAPSAVPASATRAGLRLFPFLFKNKRLQSRLLPL